MELVHVLAVFRHGDRSPITATVGTKLTMSKDETSYWTAELASEASRRRLNALVQVQTPGPHAGGVWPRGHLTERGVSDMMRRGLDFRRRYEALASGDFNPRSHIYACSTNVRRTILSAQSFLAGFCNDTELSPANPLIVHTVDPKELTPLLTDKDYRLGAQRTREVALVTVPGYQALEDTVKEAIGIRGVVNWASLREVLDCRHAHSLPFPEGIPSAMYEAIGRHAGWEWYTFYSDPHGGQRGFAQAMRNIQTMITDAIQMAPHLRRFTLVSAHDNSLVALVCALQLHLSSGFVLPTYGSMLVIELYRDKANGSYHVDVRWDGKALRFPHQTTSLVPVGVLQEAIASFIQATSCPGIPPSSSAM